MSSDHGWIGFVVFGAIVGLLGFILGANVYEWTNCNNATDALQMAADYMEQDKAASDKANVAIAAALKRIEAAQVERDIK